MPVYGVQTKLAIRMIALQEADDRIDIVRAIWEDRMADTGRLLHAFTRHPASRVPEHSAA